MGSGQASSRVRICLATDSAEPSGVGRHLLDLAEGVREAPGGAPWEVTVVGDPRTSLLDAATRRGFATAPLHTHLRQWFEEQKFDLTHIHAGIGWEGHALTHAASASGSLVLRTEHLPWLLTDPEQIRDYFDALPLLSRVVAVSHGVAESFVAAGIPRSKMVTIPNGIDAPAPQRGAAQVCAELGAAGAPVILHVGRFTAQKRHDLLLKAFPEVLAQHPRAQLALVGTGAGQTEARRLAEDLGIAHRVSFLDARQDIGDLMRVATALALPSDFEGLPLVLLEAMAVGLPVVATGVTGIAEVIDDTCAHLVAPDDPADLARALCGVLSDPREAGRRAHEARQRHAVRHTRANMQAATLDLYHRICQEALS